MIIRAGCKINIGLDVIARRGDGFHEIATVMVPVRGLHDTIRLRRCADGELRFEQRGAKVECAPEQNLCVRAYEAMRSRCGIGGAEIELDKRIPFGAGLGGGSSDAAAVLRGLDALFGLRLGERELCALAAELGSDVPFFIRDTAQLCTSRGEAMTPFPLPLAGYRLVVVKPPFGISTAEAYGGVTPRIPARPLPKRLAEGIGAWRTQAVNDFEAHLFRAHPRLRELKQALYDSGALYASLSGSGSALFGIFPAGGGFTPSDPDLFLHSETFV